MYSIAASQKFRKKVNIAASIDKRKGENIRLRLTIIEYASGIRSEGLFRLSGSAPKILQLENIFSREPDFGKDVDLSAYDVHTLAGTFKKLLRSLPEPVIPHHLHVYYLNGYRMYFFMDGFIVNNLALTAICVLFTLFRVIERQICQ